MFKPKAIFFEKEIGNYELGKELLKKYEKIPKVEIENHNNIEEMRKKSNKEFMDMKRNLIIGVRKTHKFVEKHKTSDYLVWTIENFKNSKKGLLTFPTKFDMVGDLLNLDHKGKVIVRMSVNPEEIINKVEFGTSRLKGRIEAINKLKQAGYKIGILIAPVILVENWKTLYLQLIQRLSTELTEEVKKDVFFEIIFMTYSYVHTKINEEAFPNAINLYDKEIMTGRGKGKYMYKQNIKSEAEIFIREQMKKYFPQNSIMYIV